MGITAVLLCSSATVIAQKKPTRAVEEDKQKEALEHFKKGVTYYNLGEFEKAVEEFKQAYTISAAPQLLFNLAQAYRLKEDHKQALHFYKTFLRLQPEAPNRVDVEARIAEMEKLVVAAARLQDEKPRGTIPPGAIAVEEPDAAAAPSRKDDGGSQSGTVATTTPSRDDSKPGVSTAPSTAPGTTSGTTSGTTAGNGQSGSGTTVAISSSSAVPPTRLPEGTARPGVGRETTPVPPPAPSASGTTIVVESKPAAAAVPVPVPEEPRPTGRNKKLAALGTATLGAALIATGVYFGTQAKAAEEELGEVPDGKLGWNDYYQDLYDRGERDELVFVTTLAAGGAAIAASGILLYLGLTEGSSSVPEEIAIIPANGKAILSATWSF
ncbi:MAG: tetratricopeptide repeat protein [Pseudomonadota bacterium]